MADTSSERLAEIVQENGVRGVESWPSQAQQLLSTYQDRAHATYSGSMPDELEAIDGIGLSTQQLLFKGGIYTFAQLAQSTPERLSQLVPVYARNKATDFNSWIKQAASRAREQA